jgi:phosphoglycerol transferase MdoB-like AlkP superfamily enzyme
MAFLKSLSPDLFCVAINSGGKEFICGGDYTHMGIRWLQLFGHAAWVMLLVIGGAEVCQRRASWLAATAWSISALLFVGLVLLLLNLPVDDCP